MADTWIDHRQRGDTVALVASSNDHVNVINDAVQAARVAAGHLNSNDVTPIAGGEHAHVGDVVATRRNDRTLITSAGEPVRNRETWTVTAIDADGSLTVVREPGHGTVTLPADYAHDHVRLGYAATEHGYQSDTVDHSISLVSSVTTRRGLYVAATRGRVDNVICVVTDSNEITEARDTLETILAFDRADVPAVAQRRILAHQQPLLAAHQQPGRTSRCETPEWFEPLRTELRRNLKTAERTVVEGEARRARLAAELALAERQLVVLEAATAPARDALDAATRRADEARWRCTDAQRRLEGSGLRGRRAARRQVDVAEARVERAVEYHERTRQRTAPHIDQCDQARARVNDACDAVYRHDQSTRLRHTLDQVPNLQRQVAAVDVWGRWARGETINLGQLGDAVARLSSHRRWDEHADKFQALGQAVRDWADRAGIDLPTEQSRTLERGGLEIGL
jgi:hypothetical protein